MSNLDRRVDQMIAHFENQLTECARFIGNHVNSKPVPARRQVVADIRNGKTEQNSIVLEAFRLWRETVTETEYRKLEKYTGAKNAANTNI